MKRSAPLSNISNVTPTKKMRSSSKLIDVEDSPLRAKDLNTLHYNTTSKFNSNKLTPASPPVTPEKSRIINLENDIYLQTKVKFSKNFRSDPISRDEETESIENFLSSSDDNILYIHGSPGTGKTQVINHLHDKITASQTRNIEHTDSKVTVIKINCSVMNNLASIFGTIYSKINDDFSTKKTYQELLKLVSRNDRKIIIILDEIDNLNNSPTDIQNLFNFSMYNIKFVSISNNLKILNMIKGKLTSATSIKTLEFKPYTEQQIQKIINHKFKDSGIIHPTAVIFLSKKIAVMNGDLRKILDIAYKAIETAQIKKDKILISHIVGTITQFSNNVVKNFSRLNFYQKQIICLATKLEVRTVNNLYDLYNKKKINHISKTEFLEMIGNLDSIGILKLGDLKKEIGLRGFEIAIKSDELRNYVNDNELLVKILDEK